MNAPAIKEKRATDFDHLNVGIFQRPAEQGHGAKPDCQHVASIFDRQVMNRSGENQHQQADGREQPLNRWCVLDEEAQHEKYNGKCIDQQAERSFLRVGVTLNVFWPIHRRAEGEKAVENGGRVRHHLGSVEDDAEGLLHGFEQFLGATLSELRIDGIPLVEIIESFSRSIARISTSWNEVD